MYQTMPVTCDTAAELQPLGISCTTATMQQASKGNGNRLPSVSLRSTEHGNIPCKHRAGLLLLSVSIWGEVSPLMFHLH